MFNKLDGNSDTFTQSWWFVGFRVKGCLMWLPWWKKNMSEAVADEALITAQIRGSLADLSPA